MHIQLDIRKYFKLFFALALFTTISVFRIREYGSANIDYQILIKTISWLSFGGLGIVVLARYGWQKIHASEAFSLMLFVFFLISFSYSSLPSRTFIISIMFIAIWIGLRSFVNIFTTNQVLAQTKLVLLIFLLASVFVYLFIPELGRQGTWFAGKYIYSFRMTGLSGGANGLGEVASYFSLLCFWDIITQRNCPRPWGRWLLFAFGIILLFASWNKMGIGSTIIGLLILNYNTSPNKENTFKFVSLTIIVIVIAFSIIWGVGVQGVSQFISRSGDAQEVLSFTGRSYIWPIVLQAIQEKPILGSGFGTLSIASEGDVIGFVAAHAHNIILQALSAVGIVGLLLFALSTVLTAHLSILRKNYLVLVFLIVGLLRGFTESGLFAGTPNMSLFAWLIAIFLAVKPAGNITSD